MSRTNLSLLLFSRMITN